MTWVVAWTLAAVGGGLALASGWVGFWAGIWTLVGVEIPGAISGPARRTA
jgi:hypothetical protein